MYEDRLLPVQEWWLSDRLYILKDKPTVFGNPDYQMNSSSVQKQLKAAGWTMEQYEHQYRQAFAGAAKVADPTWKAGKPIPAGALDGITREPVESGRKSVDIKL